MANEFELPIVYRKTKPKYHGVITVDGKKQKVDTYMLISGSLVYFVKTNKGETVILQTEEPDVALWKSKEPRHEYVFVTQKTPKRGVFVGEHAMYDLGKKHFIDVRTEIVQRDIVFCKVQNIWKDFFVAENDYAVYYIIVKK